MRNILIGCLAVIFCVLQPASAKDSPFVDTLEKQHGKWIVFESPHAEEVVNSYDIDCHFSDKRVLPLRNLLLSRLHLSNSNPSNEVLKMIVGVDHGGSTLLKDVYMNRRGDILRDAIFAVIDEEGIVIANFHKHPDELSEICGGSSIHGNIASTADTTASVLSAFEKGNSGATGGK